MESNQPYASARYAWALTGLLCGLLLAWSFPPSSAQTPAPAPAASETTRVFGSSNRTVGGPGEYNAPADGKRVNVFTNMNTPVGVSILYCATIENFGDVPLTFEVARKEDNPNVPVGASLTRCNALGAGADILVTCGTAKGKMCRYRWRVDNGGLQN